MNEQERKKYIKDTQTLARDIMFSHTVMQNGVIVPIDAEMRAKRLYQLIKDLK